MAKIGEFKVTIDSLIRVAHIISGLDVGGAELTLYKLLTELDQSRFAAEVISLTNEGPVGRKIKALGIPVWPLRLQKNALTLPLGIFRIARLLRERRPDLVQTWMYHADLVGGLAAVLAGVKRVVWNIRRTDLLVDGTKQSTIWTAKLCARLSPYIPFRIITCSEAAKKTHTRLGYAAEKIVVIPNGFDLEAFRPEPNTRSSVRRELGVAEETPLVGMIARFEPPKDHRNFVQAAARLHAVRPDAAFLLCGRGIDKTNPSLVGWIKNAGLSSQFHLLGQREDIPQLMTALDIATLSSMSEGFPNVVGEAMACGIPCVVTDVGDSALIVGDTGYVVPPRNPVALGAAWHSMLALDRVQRQQLGQAARCRIQKNFSLAAIASRYAELYQELVEARVAADS